MMCVTIGDQADVARFRKLCVNEIHNLLHDQLPDSSPLVFRQNTDVHHLAVAPSVSDDPSHANRLLSGLYQQGIDGMLQTFLCGLEGFWREPGLCPQGPIDSGRDIIFDKCQLIH